MKNITLFALAFTLLLSSCSKDDNNDNNTSLKRALKIDYSLLGEEIVDFTYNQSGQLATYKTTRTENNTYWLYEFTYDENKQLKKIQERYSLNPINSYTENLLSYKGDTIFQTSYIVTTGVSALASKDTLIIKNNLLQKMFDREFIHTFEYDNDGNLTKAFYKGKPEYTYKQDSKKSFLSNQGTPVWLWLAISEEFPAGSAGKNNMTEIIDGEETSSYNYTYDADGYPTEIFDTKTNTKIGVITYEVIK